MPRTLALAVMALLIPLGLGTKLYHGPAEAWVHAYGGDLLYAAFCLFVLKAVLPTLPAWKAVVAVLGCCFLVELSQLLHVPALVSFRRTTLGAILLGSSFEYADLAYYTFGAGLSGLLARACEVRRPSS